MRIPRSSRVHDLPAPGPRIEPLTPHGAVECKQCGRRFIQERWEAALRVCPDCGYHGVVPATTRASQLADPGTVEQINHTVAHHDPLAFNDGAPYAKRVEEASAKTGLDEAFLIARATMSDQPVVLACMDFGFMGGSLSTAAGALFLAACDTAVQEGRALVAVCTSGGARMQEGIASLAQLARTTSGVVAVNAARLPYISILADPCFGGVTASFAVQSDVILAEPAARIGFAGGRVIEQAAHETLPEGFQTAEFLLAHGMIDAVVERAQLAATVARLLRAFTASQGAGTDG